MLSIGTEFGSLSNDDDNYGVENVSLKVNLRCFKIHRS